MFKKYKIIEVRRVPTFGADSGHTKTEGRLAGF